MSPSAPTRLDSVDALRGLTVAAMIFVNDPGNWAHLWWPFAHADWHGCTPTDLIFPTFLFLVGVSLALAGGPRRDAGEDTAALQRAWWWRAARILLLGWALAALIALTFGTHWRPFGVLQRIAICFGVVGWLYLHATPRVRWATGSALLIGYGLLLQSSGDLGRDTSLPSRLDATLLGPFAYKYDPATGLGHEPEGLLSTLGALATTLLGAACGDWLRQRRRRPIVLAGLVCTAAGLALHLAWLPMNKALWTPPFVLFTGGLAALALALAHALVDRAGWPPLGRRFGINAITAYAGSMLMVCLMNGVSIGGRTLHAWLAEGGLGWITPLAGPQAASHAYALLQVLFWWGVLRWMDARRIRVSI
jgi:predicted acyltransferase